MKITLKNRLKSWWEQFKFFFKKEEIESVNEDERTGLYTVTTNKAFYTSYCAIYWCKNSYPDNQTFYGRSLGYEWLNLAVRRKELADGYIQLEKDRQRLFNKPKH